MRKEFDFTKDDIDIKVEMELKEENGKIVFSASGDVSSKDIECGGQCLDEIKEILKDSNKTFNLIHKMWKKYHLNDMHAGTPKQEKFLEDNNVNNWANDYTGVCGFLKDHNLYIDDGYAFGSGWLYEEIPPKDLSLIKKLLKGGK